ncbi:hypothetical protein ACLJJ6_00850 [Pediococcus siamensis]|uniref:hypothetical protein n=1 Tax=Pediococcus siamensis TaxID=381829 RepID=UPI0039A1CCD6
MLDKYHQRLLAAAVLILVIGILKPFPVQLLNTLCWILGAVLIVLLLISSHQKNK